MLYGGDIVIVEEYLKEIIGDKVYIEEWNAKKYLPLSLCGEYCFYNANILEQSCLLLKPRKEVKNIEQLKKHIFLIKKAGDYNIIFLLPSLSAFKRKNMIINGIPFILEDKQMFLPFIGLDLKISKEKALMEKAEVKFEKFVPSTQVVYLYFLYNKERDITLDLIVSELKYSKMTASRAVNDLIDRGLLTFEIVGETKRKKVYNSIDKKEYYIKGKEYLVTPLIKTLYMNNNSKTLECPKAGVDALAEVTMLNPPKVPVRALGSKQVIEFEDYFLYDEEVIEKEDYVEMQVWSYNPNLLEKDKQVDIISLMLTMEPINDERIEMAFEERLGKEEWYTV